MSEDLRELFEAGSVEFLVNSLGFFARTAAGAAGARESPRSVGFVLFILY